MTLLNAVPLPRLRSSSVKVTPLQTDPSKGPGSRNITLTPPCTLNILILGMPILTFRQTTLLAIPVLGIALPTWPNEWRQADPLYLSGLTNEATPPPLNLTEMFPTVLKLLQRMRRLPAPRVILVLGCTRTTPAVNTPLPFTKGFLPKLTPCPHVEAVPPRNSSFKSSVARPKTRIVNISIVEVLVDILVLLGPMFLSPTP